MQCKNIKDLAKKYKKAKYGLVSSESAKKEEDFRKAVESSTKDRNNVTNKNEKLSEAEEKKKQEEEKKQVDNFPKDLPSKKKETPDYSELDKQDKEYLAALYKGLSESESAVQHQTSTVSDEELKSFVDGVDKTEFSEDESEGSSENALGFIMKLGDIVGNGLENMRDNLYINEYIMGTFKNGRYWTARK